jgi:hypothetical protein
MSKTRKRELALELCEIMGWDDSKAWSMQNCPLKADDIKAILDKITGLQLRKDNL